MAQLTGPRQVQRTMLEIVNQLDGFDSRGNVKAWLSRGFLGAALTVCKKDPKMIKAPFIAPIELAPKPSRQYMLNLCEAFEYQQTKSATARGAGIPPISKAAGDTS